MILTFWASLFIIFYTYIGYGIILFLLLFLKRKVIGRKTVTGDVQHLPSLTLIVAAYNEETIIEEKIKNTFALKYPLDKIRYIFITDGSTDKTPQVVARHPRIMLMHTPERKGKINAIHRAMKEVVSDVVVFTDANTFLNQEALLHIARHYADAKVGAVSGEKRVAVSSVSDATAGEGFYWKYESTLKKWDAELYSVVGAAGELFSIRTALYQPVLPDTVLDDFMISMLIAKKDYRIAYEPDAYALETSSASISEELKRKIRIAAGGIQSVLRLKSLLNPVRYPLLSFQYISHRVLRWTVTPFFMILAFLLNCFILTTPSANWLYFILLMGQTMLYGAALLGWLFEKKEIKIKILFIPYYFCLMNYAVIAGMVRYFSGRQSAAWEKAKRR